MSLSGSYLSSKTIQFVTELNWSRLNMSRMWYSSQLAIKKKSGIDSCCTALSSTCRISIWDLGSPHSSKPSMMMKHGLESSIDCAEPPASTAELKGLTIKACICASSDQENIMGSLSTAALTHSCISGIAITSWHAIELMKWVASLRPSAPREKKKDAANFPSSWHSSAIESAIAVFPEPAGP